MPRRRLCPERGFALYAGGFALVLVAIMALRLAPQKRERDLQVIDYLLESACPISKLLRTHLHEAGDVEGDEVVEYNSEKITRQTITRRLHEVDSIQTPYGSLIEEMDVPCIGEPVKLSYINPFALLYYASSISREFYDWVCRTIPEGGGGSLCTQMKSAQAMA